MSDIKHFGFVSSIRYDNLTPWHITTSDNEIINFTNSDGTQLILNDLFIEANETELYVRMLPSDFCLYVPAGEVRSYPFEAKKSIQVMGATGTNIRWSGRFY